MLKNMNTKLLIIISGRVFQIIIALVAIKIATKYLDASQMGNYYLVVSIAGFFSLFLINPIGQYINRKTHKWYEEKKILNVFYIFNYYILLLSFLSMAIIFILYSFGIGNNINLFTLTIILSISLIFNTWNQTIIPMINMLEYRVSFVLLTLASQLLFLIFAYLFINIFAKEGIYWFAGQVIAFGLMAIISLIYFKQKIQNNFNITIAHQMVSRKSLREILKFTAPLSLSVLFFWMQTQSYPLIIEKYLSSEFLGYFGVGIAVSLAISTAFESIVMQYIYPSMYKSMNNDNEFSIIISDIINLILPIYFLLAIFVSIFAIYINSILVDNKFFDSYIFIIFGIWISFFRMSSNVISNIAHSKMKTKSLILPNFIGAITTVIGVIVASKTQDYQLNIPIVLMISTVISFLIMYKIMNKLVSIQLKIKNFFLVLILSIPFLIGVLFYNYSNNILYSIIIVGSFGLYFLLVLYLVIKKGAIKF
jgi:O-antigen/teichoic acid export membrane protein